MSIIRENLMNRPGYSPYCGAERDCWAGMPRTTFDGEQFKCKCGWRSQFPAEFIAEYKAKWEIGADCAIDCGHCPRTDGCSGKCMKGGA